MHISIPHLPGHMSTICPQSFETMPTVFLWKGRYKNDDGLPSTHEQGSGKILESALVSRLLPRMPARTMMRATAKLQRYSPGQADHFVTRAGPRIGTALS